ncbi:hypothetical protein BJP44_04900 [Candidatus Williamhamiltonella defendens]|nr:hypothetical protein BJP44_04900 [Candidatus Hamiltonella defensa]
MYKINGPVHNLNRLEGHERPLNQHNRQAHQVYKAQLAIESLANQHDSDFYRSNHHIWDRPAVSGKAPYLMADLFF